MTIHLFILFLNQIAEIIFESLSIFENSGLLEQTLNVFIEEGWENGTNGDLIYKLESCSSYMYSWGRHMKVVFKAHIDQCCKEMETLCESSTDEVAHQYVIA